MFERFTDNARQVIVCSQGEARALMQNHIGTEHLLLGMLGVESGVASRALHSLNMTLPSARSAVGEIAPPGEAVRFGQIPFTPRAKKVLELALRQALLVGSHEVDTEHLLLGLVQETDGVAAQVLRAAGIDAEAVRAAVARTPKQESVSRVIELAPDLRTALSEAAEAVATARRLAELLEDTSRAHAIDNAERLLRRLIS